jgi:hypothetical protein
MADPFRLRIMKAMTALIEAVQVEMKDDTGADITSLAGRVFRGREQFGDNDPLPMVSLLEPPLTIEPIPAQPDNTNSSGAWDILIQGWVIDDKDNPCDPAYVLAALVRRAIAEHKKSGEGKKGPLGSNYLNEGLRVQNIRIGAPVVRPADFPSTNACFYLLITLEIVEDMLNPFG